MSRIETHFVRPLTEFYRTNPFGSGFAKRLEPYAQSLSEESLQAIATRLIETGGRSFPNFNTCRSALQASETAMKAPLSTELRPWQKQEKDKADWNARLAAVKMCRCRMGEEADQEGWLPALIEFAQDRGRLPGEREIPQVRAVSRRDEEALDEARGAPFYRNLVVWRQNMLDKAHKDVFGWKQEYQSPEEFYDKKSKITEG